LTRLLGRASPIAMVVAALVMAVIMLCVAEVASQFSEPGGPYLYVRSAFGRFAGVQLAWFHLLSAIGGGGAYAAPFLVFFSGILPWSAHGWYRLFVLTILIVIPAVANYIGVRSGARLANLLTVAKLLPLGLLIFLGLVRFGGQFELLHVSEVTAPRSASWLSALLLLIFAYG